jgi:hypothetical protein
MRSKPTTKPTKEEVVYTALQVKCPACQSHAGERCTQPTDNDRRPVMWYHTARVDLAQALTKGWLT